MGWNNHLFSVSICDYLFLMIRPQKKQQQKRQEMMDSLKVNDAVVTIGGIHGRIIKIKDDNVI